jgi:putative ABC transport system permease protein
MDIFVRDLAYAIRSWRRRPGAMLAAVAALALGIGANTAVFSVVAGVLLRPLPYDRPERIVMVWQDMRARGGPEREWASPGHFVAWRDKADVFEAVGAVRGWQPNLTGVSDPERLRGAAVSQGYFAALGVPAALGRVFSPEDDAPGGEPIAILSHAMWARRFNSDPSIVGRAISLDGQPTTVVGVMPASFRPPIVEADLWAPIRINPANAPYGMIVLRVLARLKPDVSVGQAQAAMAALASQSQDDDPEMAGARIALVPLHDDMVGSVRAILFVLTGAVALVLLIACANVTSLLLARASERSREITIRVALGAGRSYILRQLLAESTLLALAGGALGAALAWWSVHALVSLAPAAAPRIRDVSVDLQALAFALVISLLAALASGLAPALAAARAELTPALRDGGRESTGGTRMRSALVVFEVAVAVILVVGAALLVRSLVALQRVDLGFRPDHVLTTSISPPRGSYRGEAPIRQLYAQIVERAAALPSVEVAATTSILPMAGMDTDFTFDIVGRAPSATPGGQPVAWFRVVSPDYFRAIGMRIVEGRGITPDDAPETPRVVVLNETLARRYWSGQSPLGQKIDVNGDAITIVGIVADIHQRGPSTPPQAEMFLPGTQMTARGAWLVLRTRGEPAAVVAPLRQIVRDIDPNLPLAQVMPMSQLAERALAEPSFLAVLLSGFSGVAAVLALVGIYSVLSFSVSRRVREIGVRMALGAERRSVVALVLRQSLGLVAVGLIIGSSLAVLLSRVLRTLLFEVKPGDPGTVVAMALLIALAALAASYPPAWRASRIDPIVALRED